MAEETWPWSLLTPLLLEERRMARAVMLKLPFSAPRATVSSGSQPTSRVQNSR